MKHSLLLLVFCLFSRSFVTATPTSAYSETPPSGLSDPLLAASLTPFVSETAAPSCLAATNLVNQFVDFDYAVVTWATSSIGATETVLYRPQSTTAWLDEEPYSKNLTYIRSLRPNVAYDWCVETSCPASTSAGSQPVKTLSAIQSFTTAACPVPTALTVLATSNTGALVSWEGSFNPSYTVRWRPVGASTWRQREAVGRPFSLMGLMPATQYEWQVQTVCKAATASFTPSVTFTTACNVPPGTRENEIGSTYADLYWYCIEGDARYEIVWQEVGATVSHTITGLALRSPVSYEPVYRLTGLNAGTAYSWQVRMICADGTTTAFTNSRSFTTDACPAPPDYLSEYTFSASSVELSWQENRNEASVAQVRLQGTTDWTDYRPTYERVTLKDLNASATYEWRVALTCSASQTVVSAIRSFTTAACPVPTDLTEVAIDPTAAWLDWGYLRDGLFSLQYKQQATSNWISRPFTRSGYYVLRGLTPGVAYDWRVVNSCSGGATTISDVRSFTAQCTAPINLFTQGRTATGALVGWYRASEEQEQRVRWREMGSSSSWNYGVPTTAGYYSLTGLTNAVEYEWQVQSICAGQETPYSRSSLFKTECLDPYQIDVKIRSATQVRLSLNNVPAGTRFELVWAEADSPTANSITTPPVQPDGIFNYDLTNLVIGKVYRVQVRTQCGPSTASAYTTRTFQIPQPSDYSLSMAVDNRTPKTGDLVTYALTLRNQGVDSVWVSVRDRLPIGLSFFDTPEEYTVFHASGSVEAQVRLAPNQERVVRFRVSVNRAGTYINAAEVYDASSPDSDSEADTGYADGDDDAAQVDIRTQDGAGPVVYSPNPNQRALPPVASNQPVADPAKADLSLQMNSNVRTPKAGELVTLTLQLTNRGGANASGATSKLLLPDNWQMLESNWVSTGMPNEYVQQNPVGMTSGITQSYTVSVRAAGSGPRQIRAQIASSNVPDSDSTPNNGYTNGEDDTATIDVRM